MSVNLISFPTELFSGELNAMRDLPVQKTSLLDCSNFLYYKLKTKLKLKSKPIVRIYKVEIAFSKDINQIVVKIINKKLIIDSKTN